ncbi:MAG TPA: DUF4397 domain-containing protein [Candidatus Tumulicola sp.]
MSLRFLEAAPSLEALVNGVPTDLGASYLSVNGTTASTTFPYSYLTTYSSFRPGTESIEVLDSLGYKVGPIKTDSLTAGKQYTIVLVGSYPNYKTIAFEDPSATTSAQLTVYEASPSYSNVDFGRFQASSRSGFQKLGSAAYGAVVSLSLAKSVSNFGGYIGKNIKPFADGALTLAAVNSFDQRNVLPFNAATRMSLFVFDRQSPSDPPTVLGSLDP